MPTKTQQIVLGSLGKNQGEVNLGDLISGLLSGSDQSLQEALAQASQQVGALNSASQLQAEALGVNTQAVSQNTTAQSSGGVKGALSTAGSVASTVFGSGLGLMPLVSLWTTVDTGHGNVDVEIDCPIVDDSGL